MMRKIFLFILFCFATLNVVAQQNFPMNGNATHRTCNGIFTDSGGTAGNYANNQTFTVTFCPETAGSVTRVDFTAFDLENNADQLFIYDGDDTSDPLIGTYSGDEIPLAIIPTANNASGCLTFRFISDGNNSAPGWEGVVSCVSPCQAITSRLVSVTPAPQADGIVKSCPNSPIIFTGAATFSGSSVGARYVWEFGDGTTGEGLNISKSYAAPGVYRVNLVVYDAVGCRSNNIINQVVQISTDPTITSDIPTEICFNEATTFGVNVEFPKFDYVCSPPVSGTTFLPDGRGESYTTSVMIDCYPQGQKLTDIAMLQSICLNMEHSYTGDLFIDIISPSGQTVRLYNQGGGSRALGDPFWDANNATDLAMGPGTGATYCFTPQATVLLNDGPTQAVNNYTRQSVVPGDYMSSNPMTALLGSDVNGVWTIKITDNLGVDNGYIFWWGLTFDPNLLFADYSFQPQVTNIEWLPNEFIENVDGTQITVRPTFAGQQCFTAKVTNNFGCVYLQEFCTNVLPEIVLGEPRDLEDCADDTGFGDFDLTQVQNDLSTNPLLAYSYFDNAAAVEGGAEVLSDYRLHINDSPRTIYVKATDINTGCSNVKEFEINVADCILRLQHLADLSICEGQPNSFNLAQYTPVVYYGNVDYNVTYHNTQADAIAGTAAIQEPLLSNYVGTNGETIWVKVIHRTNAENNGITSFKLYIHPRPEVIALTAVNGCEIPGTGLADFDLSSVVTQATGGASSLEVSFYPTQAEAELGDVATSFPILYRGPQGTIYVRVYNPNTGCYSIMPLLTNVRDTPIATQIAPLEVCDVNNDGYATFNLDATRILIAGNPIPTGIFVTFHETLTDANNNVLAIQDIYNYGNIVANSQTIYVRVGYKNSLCASIVPLELIVKSTPVIVTPTPLVMCDLDGDNIATYDLTSKITEILNGLNPASYEVSFHTSQANAESGTNRITNPGSFSNLTSQTVYVRVQDRVSGCFSVVVLQLRTEKAPVVARPIATYSLCDDNTDGFLVFDLGSRIPFIVGAQRGLRVTFHYSAADAQSGTGALANNYMNVVQNVQTLHVRVTNELTGCYAVSTMDIRVTPLPVLTIPAEPFVICNTGQSGFGVIDLTSYIPVLLNGGPAYTITFYETEANAINDVSRIANPQAYPNLQSTNPVVWVRALNATTLCSSVYSIRFKLIAAVRVPLELEDIELCDTYGNLYDNSTLFDLRINEAAIRAFQNQPGNLVFSYYLSETAANAGTARIGDPSQYLSAGAVQTIWVRAENADHPTVCYGVGSFEIRVNQATVITQPDPIIVCNEGLPNDHRYVFDLTIRENQMLGEPFETTITYHLNEQDALAGTWAIANPTSYTNASNPQTIWVSVLNSKGCRSVTTLTIRVLPLPEPNMTPEPLQLCEDALGSGTATFDLEDAAADIRNFDPTLGLSFFYTADDAMNNVGAIGTPRGLLSGTTTIYVRVINNVNAPASQCFVIVPLDLIVNSLPQVGPMTPLVVCIENAPDFYRFNLHDKDAQALAGQNAADFNVRYYFSQQDAIDDVRPLAYNYTNVIETEQEIWVRVENIATECFTVSAVTLKIEEKVFAYPPTTVEFCDADGINDGFTTIDISVLDAEIIGNQALTANLAVRYFTSIANYAAGNAENPLAFPVTSNPQTVIAEVYNTTATELCVATVEFIIAVNKAPVFETIKDGYICVDHRTGSIEGYLMDTKLSAAGHMFTWTRDGVDLGSNTPSYVADVAGTYQVTVTSGSTNCIYSQTIVVRVAPAITIDQVNVTDGFAETNVIEVIVSAAAGVQVEYALDEGAYQDSNIFLDVLPGTHTVWARVKGMNVCASYKIVNVLNYPKFLTPNNDGYNDTWNISALKDQPESKIYIFDRHGKLLKQISPAGAGWDGTLNNQPLPSTDYWFRAEYIEPNTGLQKEATGHFTLKR